MSRILSDKSTALAELIFHILMLPALVLLYGVMTWFADVAALYDEWQHLRRRAE